MFNMKEKITIKYENDTVFFRYIIFQIFERITITRDKIAYMFVNILVDFRGRKK